MVAASFSLGLVAGQAEQLLLETLLSQLRARGLFKARGRQRTDSTHVLAAIRVLNRLELVGETFRHALNSLAVVAPDWLRAQAPPEWFNRYSHRVENYHLPKTAAAREVWRRPSALMANSWGRRAMPQRTGPGCRRSPPSRPCGRSGPSSIRSHRHHCVGVRWTSGRLQPTVQRETRDRLGGLQGPPHGNLRRWPAGGHYAGADDPSDYTGLRYGTCHLARPAQA
jgi:hypothetical protein